METVNAAPNQRLPRFERHRFRKPPFVMTARDAEIVRLVSEFRVMSSEDLQQLLSGSKQAILRRLQKLFHHGFLDRPRSQRTQGNGRMVYALGQHGAEFLAQESGRTVSVDWSEKNRQLHTQYLEHALMISRFHVAVRQAQACGKVVLERWCPDGFVRESAVIEHEDRTERIPIAPDALFILQSLTDGGRIHCFLEADRGTMPIPRFITKLRGYFAYWRSGQAEARFGMKNFLVVTATTSPERARNLAQACTAVGERGLRMFLFGSERTYAHGEPLRVLDRIWATPGDRDHHSLLE